MFHIISYNTDTNLQIHKLYHGVRLVVKSREEFTVIEHTRKTTTTTAMPVNSRRNLIGLTHSISRGFSRGLQEYSDFFRDHIATVTVYWRCKKRLYSLFVDLNWDLKAVVLIQVSYDQYKSFRASRASELHRASELQSFESRASNRGTKMLKTP